MTHQFLHACASGEMQELLHLLTDDIVFMGDGGGKARVGLYVQGRDKVVRGTLGSLRSIVSRLQVHIAEINGQAAILGHLDGRLYAVVLLELTDRGIQTIYAVLNPDKLQWLEKCL